MAKKKQTIKTDILLDVSGLVPQVGDEAALIRAQKKNAELIEQTVREKADREVGSGLHPSTGSRNKGDYPGHMSDYYVAEVDSSTGDITFDNPTQRASYFEFGTEPHEIWASGLFNRGNPARGSRGQFSRGAKALAFEFADYNDEGRDFTGFFLGEMVNHPGQDAKPIMAETVDELLPTMADNILDEIVSGSSVGRRQR